MSNRGHINAEKRKKNLPTVTASVDDLGLDNVSDVFRTRQRYHFIPIDERGSYADSELGRILIELMESKGEGK